MNDYGLKYMILSKENLQTIPIKHKQQCCSVTVIKMHACLGDALDWKAPLYLE